MFLFSESSGNPDFEANEKFDTDYDSRAYESKVAKLLGRSYARDRKTEDGKASWKDALKALSKVPTAFVAFVFLALWVRRKNLRSKRVSEID